MGHLFVSRRASSVWRPHGADGGAASGTAAAKAKRRDYAAVLRSNPQFALAFAGEVVSQAGNWFAYMAQLVLVQRFSGGSSKAVAGLLVCRLLPATLLAAPLGALADRVEKRKGLAACSLAAGACSALMCACRAPPALPLLYLLLALQAAAVSLYDPLRRSLLPHLVAAHELQEAATLDGLAFCLVLSLGAALGGFAVAAWGTEACLALDALSFLASAALWLSLKAPPPPAEPQPALKPGAARELLACLRADPALCAYVVLKACGASVWGTADILNVRFAQLQRMQLGGSESVTLGLVFAAIGVGSLVGPLLSDAHTPQRQAPLLRACAASLAVVGTSFLLLAAAPGAGRAGLALLLAGTAYRNLGSSVLWIYSTLLLQLRAPAAVLGRLFMLEQALQTAVAAVVTAAAGAAVDDGMPLPALAATSCAVGVAEAAAVLAYAAYCHASTDGAAVQDEAEGLLLADERDDAQIVMLQERSLGAGQAAGTTAGRRLSAQRAGSVRDMGQAAPPEEAQSSVTA